MRRQSKSAGTACVSTMLVSLSQADEHRRTYLSKVPGGCRGNAVPVTDARQRVAPWLTADNAEIRQAPNYFTDDMSQRNRRLVVHHYASRCGPRARRSVLIARSALG